MGFFVEGVNVLKTLVMALGAGLGAWGVINLMEGYGNDNPGAKSQGIKQLMAGGKKVYRLVKDKRKSDKPKSNLESFVFTENGIGENGLSFSKGDKFFIVAIHDDAILIEKENDDNNPYFVSAKWLQTLSNYEIGKKEV